MIDPELTPDEVYRAILTIVRKSEPLLADRIEELVNEGKEIELEVPDEPKGKLKLYRKRAPFTAMEASEVAVNVLQAHYVEFPMVLTAAQKFIQSEDAVQIAFEREPAQALTQTREEPLYIPEQARLHDLEDAKAAFNRLQLLVIGDEA